MKYLDAHGKDEHALKTLKRMVRRGISASSKSPEQREKRRQQNMVVQPRADHGAWWSTRDLDEVPSARRSESSKNTLDFVRDARLDFIQFSTLSPFEGTELFEQANNAGWYRETVVRNPVDAEELRATLLPAGWSEADLDRTLRQLYSGFYLRPQYLARQALRAGRGGLLRPRAQDPH